MTSYQYNGLGDRLRETVNGVTTTFTMDLNTGLTQALSDGTSSYIYGVGRIAQVNAATEYFLGDALGSVRQLTDASGAITYARAYDPYGMVTSTSGASSTAYGFTGEVYGDSTQLLYLRARYYSSGMGRFLTRDTWGGDANSPMSYNLWNYTLSNPINYTDPSGNVPCSMLPPEDQVNCIAVPPPPDWWINQTQLYVEGLGYFDSGHIGRGWDSAKWFVQEIKASLERGRNNQRGRNHAGMIPLRRAQSVGSSYWVDYAVFARIKDDQIYGVTYGMFIDFERGYEEYQSSKIFPFNLSGFAPADLPSDHLGFWAAMNGYERDEIPALLQCLGEVEILVPQLWGIVFDSTGIAENHEFLPMIRETVRLGRSTVYRTRNIAWPTFLEIQPIPSGPNAWQVRNRSHK